MNEIEKQQLVCELLPITGSIDSDQENKDFYKKTYVLPSNTSVDFSHQDNASKSTTEIEHLTSELLPSTNSTESLRERRRRFRFRKNKVGCLNCQESRKKRNFFTSLFSCLMPWKSS